MPSKDNGNSSHSLIKKTSILFLNMESVFMTGRMRAKICSMVGVALRFTQTSGTVSQVLWKLGRF